MENIAAKLKRYINNNEVKNLIQLLGSGLDPNFEGGWPIRLAARQGSHAIVKALLQYGANPHSLSETGNNYYIIFIRFFIISRLFKMSDLWFWL